MVQSSFLQHMLSNVFSWKEILQWLSSCIFALSPLIAYLPQYWTICEQLQSSSKNTSSQEPIRKSSSFHDFYSYAYSVIPSPEDSTVFDPALVFSAETTATTSSVPHYPLYPPLQNQQQQQQKQQQYGHNYRSARDDSYATTPSKTKRIKIKSQFQKNKWNPSDSKKDTISTHTNSHYPSANSNKKNRKENENMNNNNNNNNQNAEGGFSSISIFILVVAHLFRLEYFYGCFLFTGFRQPMQQETVSTTTSSIHNHTTSTARTVEDGIKEFSLSSSSSSSSPPLMRVQYDLLVQSILMIVVQLFLLSAMIRLRRKQGLYKMKRSFSLDTFMTQEKEQEHEYNPGHFPIHGEDDLLVHEEHTITPSSPVYYKTTFSTLWNTILFLPTILSSFFDSWISLWNPNHFWNWSTFKPYLFFLFQFTFCLHGVLLYGTFRFLYRDYNAQSYQDFLQLLCNISILLESSLALPTLLLNHQRRNTNGLSFVMVMGWFFGDWLKLLYFTFFSSLSSTSSTTTLPTTSHTILTHTLSSVIRRRRSSYKNSNHHTRDHGNDSVWNGVVQESIPQSSSQFLSSQDPVPISKTTLETNVFIWGCILAITFDSIISLQMIVWYPSKDILYWKGYFRRKYKRMK